MAQIALDPEDSLHNTRAFSTAGLRLAEPEVLDGYKHTCTCTNQIPCIAFGTSRTHGCTAVGLRLSNRKSLAHF